MENNELVQTPKTNQDQDHSENSKKEEWVLLTILKVLIAKRTDKYVLIKLPEGKSVIINAKFIKAKEHEDKIFVSVPRTFKLTCRTSAYDDVKKKWVKISEKEISPKQVSYQLYLIHKWLEEGNPLAEILDYPYDLPY